MARGKKPALEEDLARVATMRTGTLSADDLAFLHTALARGSSHLVARAARVVKDRALEGFTAGLSSAFCRLLENPAKSDPGCDGKLACLEALDATDATDPALFLTGARLVQLEASWGPPVDSATGVRSRAIRALAHMGFVDVLLVAGELLGDPAAPVRQAAAESIAHVGDRNGAGLLLLKARQGDEDPVVHTTYLSTLLELAPDFAMPRLRELVLGRVRESAELAAIALGNSGREDAADLLVEAMEATPLHAERAVLVRALGLHRSERALTLLFALITDGSAADAAEAVRALAPRRYDKGVRERVEKLVGESGSLRLSQVFDEAFSEEPD